MSQFDLDHEVADVTGESPETIAHLGFVPLTAGPYESEPDREPLTVDWDELDRHRWLPVC